MEPTVAQALDQALSLSEDAVRFGMELQTKVAELEGKLVGEKVLLEKVAAAEKRASGVIALDPELVNQAAQLLTRMSGGEPADAVKLASTLQGEPNAALQLLIKVASGIPRMQAINEGGGVKAEKPSEGDGRWV